MTKTEFQKETSLLKIMNNVKEIGNHRIACVMFHFLPWKLVVSNDDFDKIADRSYEPIIAFRTRDELWKHIKSTI